MNFLDYIEINPRISFNKGKIYPFIDMESVSTNYRAPSQIRYKEFFSGVKFQDGDTVIARITPCLQNGKRFYCKGIGSGFGSTEYLVFRPKKNDVDNLYLYYFMKTEFIKQSMINSMIGATGRQRVNNSIFKDIEVNFPDIKIQRKIGLVLSAYDDLIENNQKQIKLLEEAAQRLYKEWFVDLRFPGWENTPIVDGVPDGWKKFRFSDKINIMSGGTPKTENKNYYNGSIPFYTPKDSDGSFFAFQTETNITEEGLNNCHSQLYPENTIIITARGTVGKTTLLAVPMAMNQSCYAIASTKLDAPYFIFFSLNHEIDALKTMANGGVFNTIVIRTFENIFITIPNKNLIGEFENKVWSIMEQIKTKMKSIILYQEARDRLLPKLMSGELEV